MKNPAIFFLIALFFSCNSRTKEQQSNILTYSVPKFDWLLGNWNRLNDEDNNRTYEQWEKIDSIYQGLGYTLNNNDTVHYELMQIKESNGKWNFIVQTKEDNTPTSFEIVEWKEGEFICQNHSNDFPNKIHYWIDGDKLKAEISNKEHSIPFEFEKAKN